MPIYTATFTFKSSARLPSVPKPSRKHREAMQKAADTIADCLLTTLPAKAAGKADIKIQSVRFCVVETPPKSTTKGTC